MHGIGNDFVLIDTIRDGEFTGDLNEVAKVLCDRRIGIGGDGLIIVDRQEQTLRMRMFNPDGSESEMCGNGLRVYARLCVDRGYALGTFPVITGAGLLQATVDESHFVTLDMGIAHLNPTDIGMTNTSSETFINQSIGGGLLGTAISMGNPHLVLFVPDASKVDLAKDGPLLETHPYFPNRTNVHFVQVISETEIIQKTWERGAGITLACGTGACACAVASFLNGKTQRNVKVHLPGGDLDITYQEDGHVMMRGSAEYSFDGTSSALL